jgi:monoamine oxidase
LSEQVVIIGAGLAGMAAACEFKAAGLPFTILEARETAGGRIRTLHKYFDDGLYVDLGGEHVPNIHYRLQNYLRHFQIPVIPQDDSNLQKVLWFEGRRIFMAPGVPIQWPAGMRGVAAGKNPGDIEGGFIGPLLFQLGDPLDAGWPHPDALDFDVPTEALLKKLGATDHQLKLFALGLNSLDGEGFAVNSALAQLASANFFRGYQSSGYIAGGSESLPQAMMKHLAGDIQFGQPVRAIEVKENRFRVTHGERSTLECEHLVVAIPYSVLRDIAIDPPLPAPKQAAVNGLRNSSVTRTFLQFSERVWEDIGLSGRADTDRIVMSVYPGEPAKTKRGLLESYTAGQTARDLAAMKSDRRLDYILADLDKLFPGTKQCFEKSYTFSWDGEPWAKGAYAFYAAGEVKALYPHAAAPVGRMVFAGDHTTASPGWMESALLSGERAAREVLNSMGITERGEKSEE